MKQLQVDRYCEDNDASTTTLKWIMLTLKYIESDWNDYESGQIGLVEWCCIMSMILCCVFVQVCLVCVYVFTYFTAEKVSKVTEIMCLHCVFAASLIFNDFVFFVFLYILKK